MTNTRQSPPEMGPLEELLGPFQRFLRAESSGGILLLICVVVALIWANSPLSGSYTSLWGAQLTVGLGGWSLSKSLIYWINEGLMAIFFLVVGLEIKRETLTGELASLRQAVVPIAAACGGMLMPAALYTAFNFGGPGAAGWGIPMATDIAFALGILALLGRRIPSSLKVFLTSLAIVDDIGAIVVIAIFYSAHIVWLGLALAAFFLLALLIVNRLGVRQLSVYALLGAGLWLALLESGVHATIAGVLLAAAIPARGRIDSEQFRARARALLDEFGRSGYSATTMLTNEGQQSALYALEEASQAFQTPLQRLEHALHPWVAYVIVPLFALANAGVVLTSGLGVAVASRVTVGIVVGLVVGKPLGITLFAWLATRSGLGAFPADLTWRQLIGAAFLGGIGFTMALFIADLAFGDDARLTTAKVGILFGSLVAGGIGWLILSQRPTRLGRHAAV